MTAQEVIRQGMEQYKAELAQNDDIESYPMLSASDVETKNDLLANALMAELHYKLQSGIKVKAFELMDDWRDDHAACIAAVMILADDSAYHFSDWWIGIDEIKMYAKMEVLHEDSIEEFKEHLEGHLKDLGGMTYGEDFDVDFDEDADEDED